MVHETDQREAGGQAEETRTCVTCLGQFALSAQERRWFLDRGLEVPKRCRPCRVMKRAMNIARGRF